MKEMQLPFGILMTDFLEAVLREMASSVPVALICQSSSPHTSQLPAAKHAGCDCHSWQNAAGEGSTAAAGQRQWHLQSQMAPLSTHPHPLSNTRGPSSSVTKATQWQGMSRFWRVGSLTGFRLLSVEKGKEWASEKLVPVPPCSLKPGHRGLARPTVHTLSLLPFLFPSSPLYSYQQHSEKTLLQSMMRVWGDTD